jgi:hypothetical protein
METRRGGPMLRSTIAAPPKERPESATRLQFHSPFLFRRYGIAGDEGIRLRPHLLIPIISISPSSALESSETMLK